MRRNWLLSVLLLLLLLSLLHVSTALSSSSNATCSVSGQLLDVDSRSLLLELTTSVCDPYILTNGTLDGSSLTNGTAVGCETTGDTCIQTWNSTLTLSEGCDFSGTYNVSFQGICRNTSFECPPDSGEFLVTFQADIIESNLCENGAFVVSAASGSLVAYADAALSTPKTVFLQGDTIYFQVTATADLPINELALSQVAVTGPAGNVVLFSGGNFTEAGESANFESSPVLPLSHQANFSFLLDVGAAASGALFIVDDVEMLFTFEVEASVILQYQTRVRGRRRSSNDSSSTEMIKLTFRMSLTGITETIGNAFKTPRQPEHTELQQQQPPLAEEAEAAGREPAR